MPIAVLRAEDPEETGPLPRKRLQGESDVSIKQTITTGDVHRFNGCVNTIKVGGAPRVLRESQGGQGWAHQEMT